MVSFTITCVGLVVVLELDGELDPELVGELDPELVGEDIFRYNMDKNKMVIFIHYKNIAMYIGEIE